MSRKKYTYKNGSVYDGEWEGNKRNGYGVLVRPDGMKYEGEWKDDKPHGKGKITQTDGRIKAGEWRDGSFIQEIEIQRTQEDKQYNFKRQTTDNFTDYISLTAEKVNKEQKGKAQYKVDDRTLFVEQVATLHYNKEGFDVIWSENAYWWHIMGLLFWDVIFARVKGAVAISTGYAPVDSQVFAKRFEFMMQTNGMPADFFTTDFYKNRQALIQNRIKELESLDLNKEIQKSYRKLYGKNFRMIENWERFTLEDLSIVVRLLPAKTVLSIIERILKDVSSNRSGLPDLLVHNDDSIFLSEVKGEADKLSKNQLEWIDYLKSLSVNVQICFINQTERQIKNTINKTGAKENLVFIAFGDSTSKKREDAIAHISKQPSYEVRGGGKEQIHSATFDINDIENLYMMLDLTSGWKSQKIEFDGSVVSSTDLRQALWCFREKNKLGESGDYCKAPMDYRETVNPFNCKQVMLNLKEWKEFGYISSDTGDWVFNQKELQQKGDEIIGSLKYCPLFDEKKVLSLISKLPERINPTKDVGWAYLSHDYKHWLFLNSKWCSTWGNDEFPGITSMVGIKKLSKQEVNDIKSYQERSSDNVMINFRHKQNEKKAGCYIATAVYGNYSAPQVIVLSKYRDQVLLKSVIGRLFVKLYYFISPTIGTYLRNTKRINALIRLGLDQFIIRLNL